MVEWHRPRGWSVVDAGTQYLVTSQLPYNGDETQLIWDTSAMVTWEVVHQQSTARTHTSSNIPLDSLEGTAGHVNDASGRSGYCTHQSFPKTFKKASCALLLSSCKAIIVFRTVSGTLPERTRRLINTFDWFGNNPRDPADEPLIGNHINNITDLTVIHYGRSPFQQVYLLLNRGSGFYRFRQHSPRTDTSPFPPLASPSLRPLGCLFIVSRLFCWYSSSIVMAATPLAMAPVIREAAPAIPPELQICVSKMYFTFIIYEYSEY